MSNPTHSQKFNGIELTIGGVKFTASLTAYYDSNGLVTLVTPDSIALILNDGSGEHIIAMHKTLMMHPVSQSMVQNALVEKEDFFKAAYKPDKQPDIINLESEFHPGRYNPRFSERFVRDKKTGDYTGEENY